MLLTNNKVFNDIYKRYSNIARRWCREYSNNEDLTKDLLQVAWMRVWEKRTKYSGDSSHDNIGPWLKAVMQNACINYIRDNDLWDSDIVYEHQLTSDEADDETDDWRDVFARNDDTPEHYLTQEQETLRYLAGLSDQETAIFNLVYWDGYSYEFVAGLLGVTTSHVGSVVSRIRTKFEFDFPHRGHRVYTYKEPSNMWGDWSYNTSNSKAGPCVERFDLVEAYNS